MCENEDSRPKVGQIKPCLSENYVHLAYNSFHDVMDCFSLDPKEFYLQIMIESGFHVNAINKTRCVLSMRLFEITRLIPFAVN